MTPIWFPLAPSLPAARLGITVARDVFHGRVWTSILS
ncbi:hypothetical protein SLEP1_g36874 [Rubroshorea leprosula]|uniref:Uncharacterized protein n=1 Tax=Rubroshorea leprosula TaxID=152421 RepID=A0AAV5KSU1_9ROSI|nr:hypothetical protein SLEP1_g36874 [Rubroshorea leprosula]